MQDEESKFTAALAGLGRAQLSALFGLIRWAAAQPEEEEDATMRIIEAMAREGVRAPD